MKNKLKLEYDKLYFIRKFYEFKQGRKDIY